MARFTGLHKLKPRVYSINHEISYHITGLYDDPVDNI